MRLTLSLTAVAATALLPLASAFTDTAPFLAFTSRQSSVLDRGLISRSIASPAVVPRDIIKSLTGKADELCSLDGLAIVEIENVSRVEILAYDEVYATDHLLLVFLSPPSQA
jgi:hypothetical protein